MNNIFEETVKELKLEVSNLTTKIRNTSDIRAKIDTTRLLKDTLSLIKEYDSKKYIQSDNDNIWYTSFKDAIENNHSRVVDFDVNCGGNEMRGSGKSYALSKLAEEYGKDSLVIYKGDFDRLTGINDNCKKYGFNPGISKYSRGYKHPKSYEKTIYIVDENCGLTNEEIDDLIEHHITIGFRSKY